MQFCKLSFWQENWQAPQNTHFFNTKVFQIASTDFEHHKLEATMTDFLYNTLEQFQSIDNEILLEYLTILIVLVLC